MHALVMRLSSIPCLRECGSLWNLVWRQTRGCFESTALYSGHVVANRRAYVLRCRRHGSSRQIRRTPQPRIFHSRAPSSAQRSAEGGRSLVAARAPPAQWPRERCRRGDRRWRVVSCLRSHDCPPNGQASEAARSVLRGEPTTASRVRPRPARQPRHPRPGNRSHPGIGTSNLKMKVADPHDALPLSRERRARSRSREGV